jgi:hypothetical protein
MAQTTVSLQRSLSRFELALVVVILGVLVLVFTRRVQRVEAEMERTSVELMARQIQNYLTVIKMTALAEGRYTEIASWAGANPFELMQFKPGDYFGETDGDTPGKVPPGNWYFDRHDGELIYKLRQAGYLRTDLTGPSRIRFRIDVQFQDNNGNGRYDRDSDRFEGVSFHALDHYEWLENDK